MPTWMMSPASAPYRPNRTFTVGQHLREEETHAEELRDLLGDADYLETLDRRRRTHSAIQEGLLQREMFSAV